MNISIKIYLSIIIILILIFSCKKEGNISIATISAVGDIMAHDDLQEYALSEKENYLSLFKTTQKVFINDDLTFGNLETPINDDLKISGYPLFNAKSQLLDSLKKCGFDVLSIANNHMLDQGVNGLKSTINEIYKRGIIFAGAGLNKKNAVKPVFININNIKIGYISITSVMNIMQDEKNEDNAYVNTAFFNDKNNTNNLLTIINKLKNVSDILIVSYHAGDEYLHDPGKHKEKIFKLLADNGADIVLGHHPHVLQPVEYYLAKDNRRVILAYSLGNFISSQARYTRLLKINDINVYEDQFTRTAASIILQFDIIKINNTSCIVNPRMYPIFNYCFIKKDNKKYYNGYKTMFMDDIIAMDIKNDSEKSNNLYKIKKVVNYRLLKIKELIDLPVKSFFSE